ncbi:MAG TPA: hypothetical protein VF228_07335 [Iamia sp.]
MGPLLRIEDPRFLSWPNLRVVLSLALLPGVVSGSWDAAWDGWAGVSVIAMVVPAVWILLVLVGLHLYACPRWRRGGRSSD